MACVEADGCIFKGQGARKLCDYVTGAWLVFCGFKSECQDFRAIFFFRVKTKFGRGIETCLMTKFILKKLSRAAGEVNLFSKTPVFLDFCTNGVKIE